jgi:hypothetical protein
MMMGRTNDKQNKDERESAARISFLDQVAYLPLLHTLVEERAVERRFPSPRWRGARGKKSLSVRTLATNRDAPEPAAWRTNFCFGLDVFGSFLFFEGGIGRY